MKFMNRIAKAIKKHFKSPETREDKWMFESDKELYNSKYRKHDTK